MRNSNIPLEQKAREEGLKNKVNWNEGSFNFLLARTKEKYRHKSVSSRRRKCESHLGISLPMISDEMLLELYKFACKKYQERSTKLYSSTSGFYKTPSEIAFSTTLEAIILKNPKLKHLEVYPSQNFSNDLPSNFKMVIGNYVTDFLVFGLKIKGSTAVAIEIDGDSHIHKWGKDQLRNSHLSEVGIFTFEVQNDQVLDLNYLESAILDMYRLRNGSYNQQIARAKRMIWVKTVSCQLTIREIENLILEKFLVRLCLKEELGVISKLPGCPRAISKELKLNRSI